MAPSALLLTDEQLRPLTLEPGAVESVIDRLEQVAVAAGAGGTSEATFFGWQRQSGGPSARMTLASGDGQGTGIRVFGNPVPDGLGTAAASNTRFYVLLDGEYGHLVSLMGYALLNPVRVGAAGGLAARHLAPPGARTLGVLGSGVQARAQVQGVCRALAGIERVLVYSPTPEHRRRFADEVSAWLDVRVDAVDSPEEAIRDADVLDLATSSRAPLLTRAQAKPGALLISVTEGQIGGDFVGACHPIFTGLVSIAASNFQREPWASAAKQRDGDGLTELADVLNGKVRARKNPTEVVLFEISAYPPFDLATAQWAYAWAQEHGVGTPLTL